MVCNMHLHDRYAVGREQTEEWEMVGKKQTAQDAKLHVNERK